MEEERKNRNLELEYFFCQIDGVGFCTLKKLFDVIPDCARAYELPEKQLEEILGKRAAGLVSESRRKENPRKLWEGLCQKGICFTSYWDRNYPEQLRWIQDPPKAIYAIGKLPSSEEKTVAIIGARACSEYGRRVACTLGKQLAEHKIAVVSGMARGIDGISQWNALEAGGTSYAVLGCGVDICYPKENRTLYEKLCNRGGVLSEYAPGTAAKASLFPPRNRIISALSDVVVVVEARRKSGTIITVDMALEQGKEVMAVPGRVGDGLSEGCNDLLRQGAAPVLEVGDILRALDMDQKESAFDRNCQENGESRLLRVLSAEERMLYHLLDEYPRSVDELARALMDHREKMDYGQLCRTLRSLCCKGAARQESNTYFVKVKA